MVKDREAWHAACSPWGGNESDMTEQLNNNILMAGSKEELNNLLMRVKEDSERAGLKLSIKKTKIMASGPSTSWQMEREKVEVVTDFLFLGSKITVGGDCSHEVRR